MTEQTRTVVMPLGRDDPKPVRKARVAELHSLWCASGFSPRVMLLLLDTRRGAR